MSERRLLPRGVVVGIALLVVVILIGCVGFLLQGLSPIDALYTTVSAVTTVGYTPSHPLSQTGELFATVLILAGVGTGIYVLGSVTEFLVEGGLRGNWRRRRILRTMDALSDHFIICGFGRVGQQVATQLQGTGVPFVIVDGNPVTIRVAEARGLLYLEGDATVDGVLERVGVRRARALLACSDSDVTNVYITLSARALNPNLYVVARAAVAAAEQKLYHAGASRVVSPYAMAGNRMAHLAVQPRAVDYADMALRDDLFQVQIEERMISAGSSLLDRTVGDVRASELDGGHVLAIERDGELLTYVSDEMVIASGDRILVAGTAQQLTHFDATARG
jgi:voltage-gated potassium channel